MGYYIEVPKMKGKAEQLVELYEGEIIDRPASFNDIPEGKALICVVSNLNFDAAGLCYSEREFNDFLHDYHQPDRPRKWVLMDLQLARKLSGYIERR